MNPSLNQTLLTFLLCVGQTWMAQLILAISLCGVIFLYSERMLLLYAWSSSLREGKTAFCTELTSRKFCNLLFAFSTGFTSRSVLLLFPLLITFFIIINSLLTLFRLTQMMFSRSNHLLLCMSFETLTSMITYSGGTDGRGKLL